MKVLYLDNHLLVVEKEVHLVTQGEEGLQGRAKEWIKKEFNKPGAVFLEPIHRLDKVVTGIVIFARTSKALSRLQQALRDKKIKKTYFAEVEGALKNPQGVLTHFLVHDEFKARVTNGSDPQGKEAILHYKILKLMDGISLVEIVLETGRYHQIRVQFSHSGHPIVGDEKYGSKIFSPSGIALHHGRVEFPHPISGEIISLICDPLWLPKP